MASMVRRYAPLLATAGAAGLVFVASSNPLASAKELSVVDVEENVEVNNWSATHGTTAARFYLPSSQTELAEIVSLCHEQRKRLRPAGNSISPNGASLDASGMVSLRMCDRVVSVDETSGRVTVMAGANVGDVVDFLKPYGLTLQNYASIREQQIGGFVQAGCHGTGATIPPVDEQVVAMKIQTPGKGELFLSEDDNRELFLLARVGLGLLGVVTEVTLQCVPRHRLVEHTYTLSARTIHEGHDERLRRHKHIRYMWIPYTDTVVVVACDPIDEGTQNDPIEGEPRPEGFRLAPLRQLLREVAGTSDADMDGMSFADLRDALLQIDPLSVSHVKRVNAVEAEFWKRSAGRRIGYSDEILGFECGGQQWVQEIAFPCGTLETPSGADLTFVRRLLRNIESENVPAPAPIEQRWTASSRSSMSPVGLSAGRNEVANRTITPATIHSWVGIIMYLPTADGSPKVESRRNLITEYFTDYTELMARQMPQYNAQEHWAKIEVRRPHHLTEIRRRLRDRYPIEKLNAARSELDPHGILSNNLFNKILNP